MIDEALRAKAVRICRAAGESYAAAAKRYEALAEELGLDVKFDGEDATGPDMEAVELAAVAYLRVDPEEHGITSITDPKRDRVAADKLEAGWEPTWP